MQLAAITLMVTLLTITAWETALQTLPYGVKYSLIALVACFVWIAVKEEIYGIRTDVRSAIRRMFLSVAFAWGLTWMASTKFSFTEDNNYILAALTGLCIEAVVPIMQKKSVRIWKNLTNGFK